MTIEVTSEERGMLCDLVEERIADLGPEIHHSRRTPEYHEALKALRETLMQLDAKLNQAEPKAPV
jgi:hypothetical protein